MEPRATPCHVNHGKATAALREAAHPVSEPAGTWIHMYLFLQHFARTSRLESPKSMKVYVLVTFLGTGESGTRFVGMALSCEVV